MRGPVLSSQPITPVAAPPAPPPEANARRERNRPAATIHEVARVARVAVITVSRAINTPERVSAKTLKRIEEAVEHIGYVPNLLAGGLRSSKSRLVAALVPMVSSQAFAGLVQSLTRSLAEKGYQVMVGEIGHDEVREEVLLRMIIGRRPDAIVIAGVMHSAEARRRLIMSRIPIVETWDLTPTPIDMLVGFSHERVGYEVCEFFASIGRRKLAVINGDDGRAAQRGAAFLRCSARLGLPTPLVEIVPTPTTHNSGRTALAALLDAGRDIDGVFCASDMLAMGVLTEARVRGIAVPGTLAVVGFGDLDFSATLAPSLTTMRIDTELMGKIAGRLIIDTAEGKRAENPVVDIGCSLVRRESA